MKNLLNSNAFKAALVPASLVISGSIFGPSGFIMAGICWVIYAISYLIISS